MAYGRSIELFLVNGTADSLVVAELSNWNGKAIKIPRIEVSECKREDIQGAGVYFLFCKDDDGTDSVYVGESENIIKRLKDHINDYNNEKEKYYWTTAVAFLGRDLNKTLIRYLENRLFNIVVECRRYNMLTKATYDKMVIKESQVAAMEEFIDNIKVLINAMGYKVLEPLVHKTSAGTEDEEVFYIEKGSASAKGVVTDEGFVVFAGAIINEKTSEKSLGTNAIKVREKYLKDGHVVDLKTTEDILFSSSSLAADFVLGYSASGPQNWKLKSGKTLKEVEKEKNQK